MTWLFIFLIILMVLGGALLFAVILGAATLLYIAEIDLAIIPIEVCDCGHSFVGRFYRYSLLWVTF